MSAISISISSSLPKSFVCDVDAGNTSEIQHNSNKLRGRERESERGRKRKIVGELASRVRQSERATQTNQNAFNNKRIHRPIYRAI